MSGVPDSVSSDFSCNRYTCHQGIKRGRLSGILVKQLFGIPRVLYIVGSVLVFLGIFTPLNPVLFIALGLVFIIAGKNISKNIGEENIEEEVQQAETEAEEIRKPENVVSLLQVDPIELEFGYGIIPLADVNQGGDLLDRVVMIRRADCTGTWYGCSDYPPEG